MFDVLLMLLAAGFVWLICSFIGAKARYADYMRDASEFDRCSFEVFTSMESTFGKYRNGGFGK